MYVKVFIIELTFKSPFTRTNIKNIYNVYRINHSLNFIFYFKKN